MRFFHNRHPVFQLATICRSSDFIGQGIGPPFDLYSIKRRDGTSVWIIGSGRGFRPRQPHSVELG